MSEMPSIRIDSVPKLGAPFGRWPAVGDVVTIDDAPGVLHRWQTPREELLVFMIDDKFRKSYSASFFWLWSDHWLVESELRMGAFARLEAATLVDARKEALLRAALSHVPTLAWLYDALGVPR